MLGQDNPELLIGEVDRDLLECADRVHPQQQGRRLVEAKLLKRMRIGEHDGEVLEADTAKIELPNEHIVANDLLAGDGFELDRLPRVDQARSKEPLAKRIIAN